MDIEEALTTHLLAQTGLTALITRRFFYDEAPEGTTYPYVICINVSDVKDHTLTGQLEVERPMYQFSVYAATRASARLVGIQLKAALQDYHGTLSGITVQKIELQNELATRENTGEVSASILDQEYQIIYEKE